MTEAKSLSEYRLTQVEGKIEALEDEVDELKEFKTATIEKLTTVLEKIKDLNDSNQWLKRSIFTLIGGGAVTIVITVLGRFIQN